MDPGDAENGQEQPNNSAHRTGFWANLLNILRANRKDSKAQDSTNAPRGIRSATNTAHGHETPANERYTKSEIENACSKMWTVYVGEAERYDKALVESWKGDMNGMLIFSGLFSASLTAFLIESYKTLQPDSGDTTVTLLSQISLQLASASSGTATAHTFERTTAALLCNVLWFISLSLSLTCSLLATLVEQWAREFLHKTEIRPAPVRRARVFSFLYLGLKQFHMHTVVDVIPMLLHLSLFLFFGGLVAFLLPVNIVLTYLMGGILAVFLALYVVLTILPIIKTASPYRTPLSGALWSMKQYLANVSAVFSRRKGVDPKDDKPRKLSMTDVVFAEASENTQDRDIHAIKWTVSSLTDDDELLPFVEAIPDIVCGPKGLYRDNDHLLLPLLRSSDPSLLFSNRIGDLLKGSYNPSINKLTQARYQTACLKAIWALGMIKDSGVPQPQSTIARFGADTLWAPHKVTLDPYYAISARAAAHFGRLTDVKSRIDEVVKLLRDCDMSLEASRVDSLSRIGRLLGGMAYFDFPNELRWDGSFMQAFHNLQAVAGVFPTPIPTTRLTTPHTMVASYTTALASTNAWDHECLEILCNIVESALKLKSCPYQFLATCVEIIAGLKPLPGGHVSLTILPDAVPDPDALDQRLGGSIHDVDEIMKIFLQLLPFMPPWTELSPIYRYIARRNNVQAIKHILDSCDKENLLFRMIVQLQEPINSADADGRPNHYLHDAISVWLSNETRDMRLGLDWHLARLLDQVKRLYPHLLNDPPSSAMLLVSNCILVDLETQLSCLHPPSTLEAMDSTLNEIHDHSLLLTYHPDGATELTPPSESSISEPERRERLVVRIMETRIRMLAQFLSAYRVSDRPPYRGSEAVETIIWGYHTPQHLRSSVRHFDGKISPQTQQIFCNCLRPALQYLTADDTDSEFKKTLDTMWLMSPHWLWLTDTRSAFILAEALVPYLEAGLPNKVYDQCSWMSPYDEVHNLLQRCINIIDTDTIDNMYLLSNLPGFDRFLDSPRDMPDESPATPFLPSFDESTAKMRTELCQRFMRPAFP